MQDVLCLCQGKTQDEQNTCQNNASTQCNWITTAVCDDGSMWGLRDCDAEWRELPPIPQPQNGPSQLDAWRRGMTDAAKCCLSGEDAEASLRRIIAKRDAALTNVSDQATASTRL